MFFTLYIIILIFFIFSFSLSHSLAIYSIVLFLKVWQYIFMVGHFNFSLLSPHSFIYSFIHFWLHDMTIFTIVISHSRRQLNWKSTFFMWIYMYIFIRLWRTLILLHLEHKIYGFVFIYRKIINTATTFMWMKCWTLDFVKNKTWWQWIFLAKWN